MSFELYNTILAYGDQIKLDLYQNSSIVSKLEQFDNDWVKYNPSQSVLVFCSQRACLPRQLPLDCLARMLF